MTNFRRLSLVVSLSVFQLLSVSAFSQSITSAQAKDNVGQEKTVTGTVMKVTTLAKTVVLEFDGLFPNAPFTAVIFNEKLPAFDKATLEGYKDKSISVTGKIAEYKGKPQIILNTPDQISASGAAPAEPSPTPAPAPATASTPATPVAVTSAPAAVAPSAPSGTNLLINGNFNKGKKDWDLPADADVITDSDSQVLKITLKPGESIIIKQEVTKFPKDGKPVQISLDAKLAEGAKLTDGIKLTLGSSEKDGAHFSPKLTATTGSWQKLAWPSAKSKDNDSVTLFIEISPGEGTLLLDNIHLSSLP